MTNKNQPMNIITKKTKTIMIITKMNAYGTLLYSCSAY